LEAIDAENADPDVEFDNSDHIAEELGDLYLVATMLVQIATEEGRFRMADVMREVVTKLIRRHPHVFGDVETDNVDQIVKNWDQIKAQEKAAKGQRTDDPLAGIPAHLPALEKARELQKKASKAGLLDRAAVAQADPKVVALLADSSAERLGQLLWQLVALAHTHDLNAEDALRAYAVAFRRKHA
jgi:tetrapyrrole methylase family protein/MazG family protein